MQESRCLSDIILTANPYIKYNVYHLRRNGQLKNKSYTHVQFLITFFLKPWWLLQFLAPHSLLEQLATLVLNLSKHKSAALSLVL